MRYFLTTVYTITEALEDPSQPTATKLETGILEQLKGKADRARLIVDEDMIKRQDAAAKVLEIRVF